MRSLIICCSPEKGKQTARGKKWRGLLLRGVGPCWAERPAALRSGLGCSRTHGNTPSPRQSGKRRVRVHLTDVAAGPAWARLSASLASHAGATLASFFFPREELGRACAARPARPPIIAAAPVDAAGHRGQGAERCTTPPPRRGTTATGRPGSDALVHGRLARRRRTEMVPWLRCTIL